MADCWCGTNCSQCGGCSYNCVNCSGSGCSGGCQGGCKGSCANTCQTACNTGCSNTESVNLAKTILSNKLEASNITDIARLIYLEAKRRSKSPVDTSFINGEVIKASELCKVISNLESTGNPTREKVFLGYPATKNLGQDLIDKAIEAYNTLIGIA